MGLDVVTAKFLLFCKAQNVDFTNTATLGRLSMYFNRREVADLFAHFKMNFGDAGIERVFGTGSESTSSGYAEDFFNALGASTVDSIDASAYEGASIVHDMNKPIPDELLGRFSVLVDGGTLEHVFNFPVAIENCMRMLRKDGYFISIGPANNYFGHGFYQFSSELFFRVFSADNGFKVMNIFLSAEKPFSSWHEVPDAELIRERVAIRNQVPTLQLVLAQKISDDAGLKVYPQQSLYSGIFWQGMTGGDSKLKQRSVLFRKTLEHCPLQALRYLRALKAVVVGALTPPFSHRRLRKFYAGSADGLWRPSSDRKT
jgi:hypothetical protein